MYNHGVTASTLPCLTRQWQAPPAPSHGKPPHPILIFALTRDPTRRQGARYERVITANNLPHRIQWQLICLTYASCSYFSSPGHPSSPRFDPRKHEVNRLTDALFAEAPIYRPQSTCLDTPQKSLQKRFTSSIKAIFALMRDGWPGPGPNSQDATKLCGVETIFLLSSATRPLPPR